MRLGLLSNIVYLMSALQVLAAAVLVGRLVWHRLLGVYPWLAALVATAVLETPLGFAASRLEGGMFRLVAAARTVVAAAVLWELVRRGFEGYAALGSFIRRMSGYLIAACVAFAVVDWALDPEPPSGRSLALHQSVAVMRAVTSGLFGYLLLLVIFMGWFPVRMRRNVSYLLVGLTGFFAARWTMLLGANVSPANTGWMNLFEVSATASCTISWAMLLNREGERIETITGHRWNPAEMERVSRQLDAINAGLARLRH
jgi:hypothetical protein